MAGMVTNTAKLFYEESKAAREHLDDVLTKYRDRCTVILTVATGAAAFFGFDDSEKGPWFVAALAAYAVAAIFALWIHLPVPWLVNPAHDMAAALASAPTPVSLTKAYWDLALSHQKAIANNRIVINGRWGMSWRLQGLIAATAAVVVLAGVNVTTSDPAQPPEPTRIQIVE